MKEAADEDEDYYYLKQDMKEFKLNEIMNFLLQNSYQVNNYSTNDLHRIITYSGLNKKKSMTLLEDFTKEQLVEMINKFYTEQENNKKTEEKMNIIIPLKKVVKNKVIKWCQCPGEKYDAQLTHEKAWEFLPLLSNVIDLRDILLNHDHQKLFKKIKAINVKDNKKINELLDNYFQDKLKKVKELVLKSSCIEDNDHYFLKNSDHGLDLKATSLTGFPFINYNIYGFKNFISGDLSKFETYFFGISDNLKTYMLKFLDIFSIAKLGLVNKKFYKFTYKKFPMDKLTKSNCVAIFKNSKIYYNDNTLLKNSYSTFLSMFFNR